MRTDDARYSNVDKDGLTEELERYQTTCKRCKIIREMEFDICESDELNYIVNHGLRIPLWW